MSEKVLIGLPWLSGKITHNVHRSDYPWLVGSCHCRSGTSIDSTTGATLGFCTHAREDHNCQRFRTYSLLSTAPTNVVWVPPLDRCWQCKQLIRFWWEIGVVDRLDTHLETRRNWGSSRAKALNTVSLRVTNSMVGFWLDECSTVDVVLYTSHSLYTNTLMLWLTAALKSITSHTLPDWLGLRYWESSAFPLGTLLNKNNVQLFPSPITGQQHGNLVLVVGTHSHQKPIVPQQIFIVLIILGFLKDILLHSNSVALGWHQTFQRQEGIFSGLHWMHPNAANLPWLDREIGQ